MPREHDPGARVATQLQQFLAAFSGMFTLMRAHAESVRTLLKSDESSFVVVTSPAVMLTGFALNVPAWAISPGTTRSMTSAFPPTALRGNPPPMALPRVITSGTMS